ncbi:hypothetical protein [Microbacterium sp. Yaish 1]|uniref:hypothetical protein n=1 Tax=Microbacterium sp. Yaish 1 TaxID=2025014 RepID=UPI00117BE6B5|nr:hypothetical protein [Microbacterium sp. Yaish 1]
MAPVIQISESDLRDRLSSILGSLGLSSYQEFRSRAEANMLEDREWAARDELDSIAYLLGENHLTD